MNLKEGLKLKNPAEVIEKIVEFIKNEVEKRKKGGVVFGLSGGIDSSLGAFLCAQAVKKEKVLALFLPEKDSHPQSEKDAGLVAETLGIKLLKINLTSILRKIGIYKLFPSSFLIPRKIQEAYVLNKLKRFEEKDKNVFLENLKGGGGEEEIKKALAYYRIKHRVRMVVWYYYAELKNYLVVGNCNKTEKMIGYFVRYGDDAADIEPLSSLYKTQVRELSSFLGVPREIIKKAPAPDLIPGITDEISLGMKLEILDQVLYGLEKGMNEEEIKRQTDTTEKKIQYVKELIKYSFHMRKLPPSPDLHDLL